MKTLVGWKPVANDRRMASARLRCFWPIKYLNASGWNCELFEPRRTGKYQLVVFQKAYDDESLALAQKLKRAGTKSIFDLCDNHFYIHKAEPRLVERAERLRRMIDLVDAVSVSTIELQKLVPGKMATVIDDAVEWPSENILLTFYTRWKKRALQRDNRVQVVWYGNAGDENPPFGLIDLPMIFSALEDLNARLPLRLTVISNSKDVAERYVRGVSFPFTYHEWQESSFPYLFRTQDVCVIPITLNPFTACKTSNRLVTSLLHGVPVVADLIPSYDEFRPFVMCGDWEKSIHTYATDVELRRRHITEGTQYVRTNYAPERVVRQWSSLFRSVLG